jgi:histidinol-phosphate aminotransferase
MFTTSSSTNRNSCRVPEHVSRYVLSQPTFFHIEVPTDSSTIYRGMLPQGVIIRPINAYGLPSTTRLNLGLLEESEPFTKTIGLTLLEFSGSR